MRWLHSNCQTTVVLCVVSCNRLWGTTGICSRSRKPALPPQQDTINQNFIPSSFSSIFMTKSSLHVILRHHRRRGVALGSSVLAGAIEGRNLTISIGISPGCLPSLIFPILDVLPKHSNISSRSNIFFCVLIQTPTFTHSHIRLIPLLRQLDLGRR